MAWSPRQWPVRICTACCRQKVCILHVNMHSMLLTEISVRSLSPEFCTACCVCHVLERQKLLACTLLALTDRRGKQSLRVTGKTDC